MQLSAFVLVQCEASFVSCPEMWQEHTRKSFRVLSQDCCKPPPGAIITLQNAEDSLWSSLDVSGGLGETHAKKPTTCSKS